ncbi:peptidylprolyl isomerase [Candidatus Woesearchaeota archaeon]|nr:peptidylprolyl isomerase [Candidatus Woesearchaeota archaeon]
MIQLKQGDKVKVHYTGTLDDGTVFDSSQGREPLEFTIGEGHVIPGFENGIKDMKVNEEKTIKITAKDAYGNINEQLIIKVPRDKFPPQIEVGGRLVLKGPKGQNIPGIVHEVNEDNVVVDLNHPLAGKELTFKIKVVGIN